jgi:hypothetical protein
MSPGAVICLAVGLVVGINGLLILGLARGGWQRQVELLRRSASAAQSPWKAEDESLRELHRRVSQLPEAPSDPPH